MPDFRRAIAVDWSGALAGERRKIWLAEVAGGRLVRLEAGRTRKQVAEHLIAEKERDPELVVGLDFAFSFPAWFVRRLGIATARELWARVAEAGEGWLTACDPPFWGKPGRAKPTVEQAFRRTERDVRAPGAQPKSVFQVGGAGAVGTGSIRGMPILARLAEAGFAVWPFDPPAAPLVVEIYPRLLTGDVVKSDPAACAAYLRGRFPELDEAQRARAACSEDAFDAAVSATIMARHLDELAALPVARDDVDRLEGVVWAPGGEAIEATEAIQADQVAVMVGGARATAGCPFCEKGAEHLIAASEHAIAFPDLYPVSEGHTLVVPRRHVESVFDLDDVEQADLWRLVARVRQNLAARLRPDGFNVGVNDGRAAGQTVMHGHVHVIPRREGDVNDPRGGIRWVGPERAAYWEPREGEGARRPAERATDAGA